MNDMNNLVLAGEVLDSFNAVNQRTLAIVRDQGQQASQNKRMPCPTMGDDRHLQGVAATDSRVVLTRNDCIIWGSRDGTSEENQIFEYENNRKINHCYLDHLGGIQTIGDWVVVAFEESGRVSGARSEIRFYQFQGNCLKCHERLTIERDQGASDCNKPHRNAGKAGSVGITKYRGGDGIRYLLAVCPWQGRTEYGNHNVDGEIHFYRTKKPNVTLSDSCCRFEDKPFCTWRANDSKQSGNRECWNPNDIWRGYVNGISLLADTDGALYLVGFCKPVQHDYADLYRLKFDDGHPVLTKIATYHARCRRLNDKSPCGAGPSFRFGGSAFVTQEGQINLITCERKIQEKNGSTRRRSILMNIFHGAQGTNA